MTPEHRALQGMLAGEHAAVYAYAVIGGRLAPQTALQRQAREAYAAHRDRRDALVALLRATGIEPVAAEPAYDLPTGVDNAEQGRQLARIVEDRCSVLYATAVAAASERSRGFAVDALIDAARRGLTWGAEPVALPGVRRG